MRCANEVQQRLAGLYSRHLRSEAVSVHAADGGKDPQRQAADRWQHALEHSPPGGQAGGVAHDGGAGVEQASAAAAPVGARAPTIRTSSRGCRHHHLNPPAHAAVFCVDEKTASRSQRSGAAAVAGNRTARVRVLPARHAGRLFAAFNTKRGAAHLGAVRSVSHRHRGASADWAGDSRDRRQPVGAQTSEWRRFESGGPPAFHDLLIVAEQVELWFAKISRDRAVFARWQI